MSRGPTVLKIVAVLWLLAGVFMTLNGSACLLLWNFGGFKEWLAADPVQGPFGLFRYYGALAAVQLSGALFIIVAAIAALRLKRYGRLLLQTACVGSILFLGVFDILWAKPLFEPTPPGFDRTFVAAFTAAGLLASVVFFAPPVLTLWVLNRSDIRSAFLPSQPPTA
jgi:hypothetical protein